MDPTTLQNLEKGITVQSRNRKEGKEERGHRKLEKRLVGIREEMTRQLTVDV